MLREVQYEATVPNIVDRIAQTAAAMALEPSVEQVFHDDSYGYRPGRSPLEAVAVPESVFQKGVGARCRYLRLL